VTVTPASPRVAAVVVTFNRLPLLQQCLAAIAEQERRVDSVIVIDNGSTDGTAGWLASRLDITVVRQENVGSAGGFHRGITEAAIRGSDWFWCMDDDVVPKPDALTQLLLAQALIGRASFLSSAVRFANGDSANMPTIDARSVDGGYPNWDQFLRHGIVKVESATFVSILIARDAVAAVGLPLRPFRIWGDDSEFTARLVSYAPAYMVGRSVVCHLRAAPKPLSLAAEADPARIAMYQHMVRNHLFLARQKRERVISRWLAVIRFALGARELLSASGFRRRRLAAFARGFWAGLWFSPQVEYLDGTPRPGTAGGA
jgi:GT2 family glycosyltransferase